MGRRLGLFVCVILVISFVLTGCENSSKTQNEKKTELGTKDNPVKMAMVPSLDTKKLILDGKKLAELMHKQTGLYYKVDVTVSYAAVISAMGAGNIDVGWLSALPYAIAHDQYGVQVILTTVRDNSTKYWSFIIARNDTGINKLSDLKGKKFAYGDPVSTSGALYPKNLLRTNNYNPDKFFSQAIYAGAHDKVVMAVYNKQVDAGAIYGGVQSDAREKVIKTIPDVIKKTKVIARSAEIPNDTVSVRKGLSPELVKKITDGLIAVSKSSEGRSSIMDLYGIDGFVKAKDSDYDSVRAIAKAEKIKLEQIDK